MLTSVAYFANLKAFFKCSLLLLSLPDRIIALESWTHDGDTNRIFKKKISFSIMNLVNKNISICRVQIKDDCV